MKKRNRHGYNHNQRHATRTWHAIDVHQKEEAPTISCYEDFPRQQAPTRKRISRRRGVDNQQAPGTPRHSAPAPREVGVIGFHMRNSGSGYLLPSLEGLQDRGVQQHRHQLNVLYAT